MLNYVITALGNPVNKRFSSKVSDLYPLSFLQKGKRVRYFVFLLEARVAIQGIVVPDPTDTAKD